MQTMTNSELLVQNVPQRLLTDIERQRRFLVRRDVVQMPCPACTKRFNLFEALGCTLDGYDYTVAPVGPAKCPHCSTPVRYAVPVHGFSKPGWYWERG